MKVTSIVFLLVIASTTSSHADITFYFIVDRTPGHEFQRGISFTDPRLPRPPNPFDTAQLTSILQHEVDTGHMSTHINSGIEMQRTLDISNLELLTSVRVEPGSKTGVDSYSPATLSELAHVGGFDHFNFLQYISHLPADQQVGIQDSRTGATTPAALPILDPILDSSANQYYVHSDRANLSVPMHLPGPSDSNLSAWNDQLTTNNPLNLGNFLTATSLTFRDAPSMPSLFIDLARRDDYMGFNTSLVGVNTDGTIGMEWAGIGTRMSWSSNVIYDASQFGGGGVSPPIYSLNPSLSDVPPSIGGSVFDVQFDELATVPEPSTLLLSTIAFAGLFILKTSHEALRRLNNCRPTEHQINHQLESF